MNSSTNCAPMFPMASPSSSRRQASSKNIQLRKALQCPAERGYVRRLTRGDVGDVASSARRVDRAASPAASAFGSCPFGLRTSCRSCCPLPGRAATGASVAELVTARVSSNASAVFIFSRPRPADGSNNSSVSYKASISRRRVIVMRKVKWGGASCHCTWASRGNLNLRGMTVGTLDTVRSFAGAGLFCASANSFLRISALLMRRHRNHRGRRSRCRIRARQRSSCGGCGSRRRISRRESQARARRAASAGTGGREVDDARERRPNDDRRKPVRRRNADMGHEHEGPKPSERDVGQRIGTTGHNCSCTVTCVWLILYCVCTTKMYNLRTMSMHNLYM